LWASEGSDECPDRSTGTDAQTKSQRGFTGKNWTQQRIDAEDSTRAPACKFVLPFYKTPSNIAKWAYRRTPVLGLPGKNVADIRQGRAAAREAITRQLMGTGDYGTVASLYAAGKITGRHQRNETSEPSFTAREKSPMA